MLNIRTATTADAAGMLSIYAPHVLHDAITFETAIPTIEEFENRITKCLQKFPWIVCEADGVIAVTLTLTPPPIATVKPINGHANHPCI